MAGCDGLEGCLQIGEGLHAVDLAGFDQRGDAAPGLPTLIVTGKERILAVQRNRADQVLDPVGVDLDAAIVKEGRKRRCITLVV
jgi:hypothetical protein